MEEVLIIVFSGESNLRSKIALKNFIEKLKNKSSNKKIYGAFTENAKELELELVIKKSIANDNPKSIILWPLFILPGQKLSVDLPQILDNFKNQNPNINFQLEKIMDLNEEFFPVALDILQKRNILS